MSNERADQPHGHKEITIIVNGTAKTIQKERLTFEEVIALAFDNPPTGDGVQFAAFARHCLSPGMLNSIASL